MPIRARTADSTLAYFINQLENFDPTLHEPLVDISWGRDMNLRPGITMNFEATSFTRNTFAGPATLKVGSNMPWISQNSTTLAKVSVNGEKIFTPLRTLAREISYTSIELDRSQNTQQPIDMQQMLALNTLYQMNTDQMVYIGSDDVGAVGLVNSPDVVATEVVVGANGTTPWTTKTPDEILKDVNTLLTDAWRAAAFAVCPSDLLLPPEQFAYSASQKVSSAGNVSILEFLKLNSIALAKNGRPLNINPVKWLTGAGVDDQDRMVAYTNKLERVRFPMVPIRRETAYYLGISFNAPYVWAFGEIEFVYTETVRYADGI